MPQREKVDVLICGSGSAGLCAATWLARYGVRCKLLERREGPMVMGQADGVQCRTVEILDSFGVGEELLREAYHVLEVVFWADTSKDDQTQDENEDGIRRTGRTADTQPGLSHQPHVILNQARINGLLIECMERFNNQGIDYGCTVKDVTVTEQAVDDHSAYPVRVVAEKEGKMDEFEAKYLLACDGAHSTVRRSLGYKMVGDSTDAVWGVMDMIPRTNFPDIRKKATIRTKAGNILIIPREGQSLTRFYIELAPGTNAGDVKLEDLQDAARAIFRPYEIEFVRTVWWSAYAIGQRHADHFHRSHRVFLAGDACHTHSPKAGQGMNVSLQDGYNIGWKLGSVLTGLAAPSLLETYVPERSKVAIDLIEFDRYFSKLFSSGSASGGDGDKKAKVGPKEFERAFIQSGMFTAGLTSKYEPSSIISHTNTQALASNVPVGMRLPSSQVVRHCDSKPVQLADAIKSDKRWRVMVFPGDITDSANMARLRAVGEYLSSSDGPIQRFTPKDGYIDSLIEPVLVAHGDRHAVELDHIPPCFYPVTGSDRIRDLHKVYFDDESYNKGHGRVYEHLGIDSKKGAIVIVRPDQYVSAVLGLDEYPLIGKFMAGFLLEQ